MTAEPLVVFEARDGVAVLRLNHPETLNAFSVEMVEALDAALHRASRECRAIVLTGSGRGFSSGANLTGAGFDITDPERDVGLNLETAFNPLMRTLRDLPVPLITAVRGPAAGVACAIALMGDIIIASKNAYFLQAFVNIGLVPDGGSAYILSRAIGRVRAMEMMLLGEKLPAETAFESGLVTRLVEDGDLEDTALTIGKRLAAGPTAALKMIRQAGWDALDSSFDEQLVRERELQRQAGRTDDFVEGVSAFMDKRKADFKGR